MVSFSLIFGVVLNLIVLCLIRRIFFKRTVIKKKITKKIKNKHCRLCEKKIGYEAEDGLCSSCHIALCQKNAASCKRCTFLFSRIVKFIQEGDTE